MCKARKNGSKMKKVNEAEYLVCTINLQSTVDNELKARKSKCGMMLRQMDLFWSKANVDIKLKVRALDATIRASLLSLLPASAALTSGAQPHHVTPRCRGWILTETCGHGLKVRTHRS